VSHDSSTDITFHVKLIPRAKRNEIIGWENNALKIRFNAPPVKGRANDALIEFLAKLLDIPRGNIEIVRGGNIKAQSRARAWTH